MGDHSSQIKEKISSFDDATLGLNIGLADRERLLAYNIQDTELTLKLFPVLKGHMSAPEWDYFEKYEIPHSLNLFHLAWYGVPYDVEKAEKLASELYRVRVVLENKIYKATGAVFNIDSLQQLAKFLFYNQKVKYKHPNSKYAEPITPFGSSEGGSMKVDTDTLKALQARIRDWDKTSNFIPLVDDVIRYLELSKNLSKIENLEKYVIFDEGEFMIFPNISASTKSGRISYSGPNTIGLPKSVFKKSKIPNSVEIDEDKTRDPDDLQKLWDILKDESIRGLIKAPPGYTIARIDISGLDLVVLAQGAKKFSKNGEFYWLEFLKAYNTPKGSKVADSHFSILQKLKINANDFDEKDIFQKAFDYFSKELEHPIDEYLAMKPSWEIIEEASAAEEEGINFIHKKSSTLEFIPFPKDSGNTKKKLKDLRGFSKKLNLATSYLMGAVGLAVDLTEVMDGKVFKHDDAQKVLDHFYDVFYEIRDFQDEVSNEIYKKGYMYSPFGRKFYAETWDDLNEYDRNNPNGEYELILTINNKYWYLKARKWIKYDVEKTPVIKNMKIAQKPFGLHFNEILEFERLPAHIFRPKEKIRKKSRYARKSESNLEEQLKYELSRIEISFEVEKEVQREGNNRGEYSGMDDEKASLLASRIDLNGFLFKEKEILFYRVNLNNPASKYFKEYKKLIRSVKVFFPMYCQGVANTVAITVLTRVRERFEQELPEARVLFFIHDEVVAIVPDNKKATDLAEEILMDAVENEDIKRPFDLPFTGEFELRDTFAE